MVSQVSQIPAHGNLGQNCFKVEANLGHNISQRKKMGEELER